MTDAAHSPDEPITRADMRAEITREIAMRRRVYARQVGLGRMDQATADRSIAVMEAVLASHNAAPSPGEPAWKVDARRITQSFGDNLALGAHADRFLALALSRPGRARRNRRAHRQRPSPQSRRRRRHPPPLRRPPGGPLCHGARPMRAGVLFSGIGGWELACEANGVGVAWAAERNTWKRDRYRERWPLTPLHHDVEELDGASLLAHHGSIEILLGSPPCTDVSSANPGGRGVDGDASRLFFEAVRLIGEMRPRWACLENAPTLRSRGADRVIDALDAHDYACWPLVVAAEDLGAPHRRARSFLIAARRDHLEGPDTYGVGLRDQSRRSQSRRPDAPFPASDPDPNRDGQSDLPQHAKVVWRARAANLVSRQRRMAYEAWDELRDQSRDQVWDPRGDCLAWHLFVADVLAEHLRGRGLSEREVKRELGRWRSALGDALVIPVVTEILAAILATEREIFA